MSRMPRPILSAIALLGACSGLDTPSDPTWIEDVRPIVYANCVRCHGYPAIHEAVPTFRLDSYSSTLMPDGDEMDGAAAAATFNGYLADPFNGESKSQMPPRFPLEDRQVDILLDWIALGDDEVEPVVFPPRGERPDNAEPDMTFTEDLEVGGSRITAAYFIEDLDDDPVTGVLFAQGAGDPVSLAGDLFAGRGEVSAELSLLEPGEYDIYAELDDGVGVTTVELGSVEVP